LKRCRGLRSRPSFPTRRFSDLGARPGGNPQRLGAQTHRVQEPARVRAQDAGRGSEPARQGPPVRRHQGRGQGQQGLPQATARRGRSGGDRLRRLPVDARHRTGRRHPQEESLLRTYSMQNATKMGLNHTGAQMSAKDTEAQVKAAQEVLPDVPGGPEKIAQARATEAAQADPLGSVPLPGSAKGMLKTALNKLVGVSPEVLIDKLGERLAFERGGVRLYDALLAKAKAIDTLDKSMLQTLQHFREEEAEHLALVKAAIEKLGADPTAM